MLKLLRSSLLYSLSDLSLRMIGFFLVPIYTRVLTPDDYGIISYSTALGQIVSPIVGLGLVGTLPVLYHGYAGEERKRLTSTIVNLTLVYALAATVLLSVLGYLLGDWLGGVPFLPYILLTLWALFFTSLYYVPLGIYNMEERSISYALYSIGLGTVNVMLNMLLVVGLRGGAVGALWGSFITGVVGLVVVVIVTRGDYLPVLDWDKARLALGMALPALPHLFSGNVWRFADRFFLTGYVALSVTGVYSLAVTLSSIVLNVLGGATTALNPLFYRRAYAGDPLLPQTWARLTSLFTFGAAMVGLGLAVMGPELVQLLAPPTYHGATQYLPVLVVGQLLVGLYWLVAPAVGFTRKTWIYPVASIPAAVANVVLNVLLVPRLGADGAAWAMTGSAFLQLAVFGLLAQHHYPVPYEYRQLAKVVVLGLAVFLVSRIQVSDSLMVVLLLKCLLLALLPTGLFLWGFFSRGEVTAALAFTRGFAQSAKRVGSGRNWLTS